MMLDIVVSQAFQPDIMVCVRLESLTYGLQTQDRDIDNVMPQASMRGRRNRKEGEFSGGARSVRPRQDNPRR
jgi:hypothetical protein